MLRWKKQIRNGNITPPSETMIITKTSSTTGVDHEDSSESTERISIISPDDGSQSSLPTSSNNNPNNNNSELATVHPVSDSSTTDSSYYDDEMLSMHGDKCCNGKTKTSCLYHNSNSNSNNNMNENNDDINENKDNNSNINSSFPREIKLPKLRLKQQKIPRRISVHDDNLRLSKRRKVVSEAGITEACASNTNMNKCSSSPNSLRLALPSDSNFLNPLHCFIRRNVEVFTATADDIALPAPGRKKRVGLGQVGLRCVHCKHMPGKKRIKRAVCYPSSIGRVYHSVSDMKFDHFGACNAMPKDLIQEMEHLKRTSKKHQKIAVTSSTAALLTSSTSSSSTAQYYFDAAKMLGMVDTNTGIFLKEDWEALTTKPMPMKINNPTTLTLTSKQQQTQLLPSISQKQRHSRKQLTQEASPMPVLNSSHTTTKPLVQPSSTTLHLLALPEDSFNLNPLHCFVRRHTEVFTATATDLAVPSPGRKNRVTLGQVGLRCVFCSHLPPKDRIKRAVCYPPSVRGIYHSVSNMKFDHFGNCKGISKETKKEFESLKAQCCSTNMKKRYKNNYSTSSTSTAQYYVASAEKMGLVDTEGGIRFRFSGASASSTRQKQQQQQRHQTMADYEYEYGYEYGAQQLVTNDNTVSSSSSTSSSNSDDMDGISALVIAATDPGVRARHEARKGTTTSIMADGRGTNSDKSPNMTKPRLPRIVSSSSPIQVIQQQPQQPIIHMTYCNYNNGNPTECQQIQNHANSYAIVS